MDDLLPPDAPWPRSSPCARWGLLANPQRPTLASIFRETRAEESGRQIRVSLED